MIRGRLFATFLALAAARTVAAQAPTNPTPPQQPPGGPPPGLNAAQPQAMIPSFPTTAQPSVAPVQPFSPMRPPLSPYLNLFRGGTGGISAIDYFNFVLPAQQATGSYVGRVPGSSFRPGVGFTPSLDPDVLLEPASSLRPAGIPSVFQNTGGYFNSMGTIGMAGRSRMAQQQQTPMGRR